MITLLLRSFLIFSVAMWPVKGPAQEVEIRKSQLPMPSDLAAYEYIRVLVLDGVPSFQLSLTQPYKVYDAENRLILQGGALAGTAVKLAGQSFMIGSQSFSSPYIRLDAKGLIKVNDKTYGESIVLLKNPKGGMDVVNEVDLERYLKGVLPKEVSAGWPPESLKAQAVASRTYAFFRMVERASEPYDVASDVTSQVFGGESAFDERTSAAVDATRGLILIYRGSLFPAFFHSNSGGHTTDAASVWSIKAHPALKGVKSEFSLNEKHAAWSEEFTYAEMETALRKHGVALRGLTGVKPDDLDDSGRYRTMILYDQAGRTKVKSSEFRIALDPFRFKSTLLTSFNENARGMIFRGRGWGHGVGLCQYGNKNLAGLGYDFESILKYYYPSTNLHYIGRL